MHKSALFKNTYVIYSNSLIYITADNFVTRIAAKEKIRKIARPKEIIFIGVEIGIITTCRNRELPNSLFLPIRS